jgi:hypothetical protein
VVPLRKQTTTCFSLASRKLERSCQIKLSVYSLRGVWAGSVSFSSTKDMGTFDRFA